jgi:microcystin-dependent protein
MDPFIGEIRMFGGNFAPKGWAFCNGQLLSISQNTALFSILGTTYGGNGQTTFALPDLQCRVPMHWGNGAGLSPKVIGEVAGTETVTLLSVHMAPHTHPLMATNNDADNAHPVGNTLAGNSATQGTIATYAATPPSGQMNPASIGPNTGGGQPVPILNPFLCVSFIIALEGIYPSRN